MEKLYDVKRLENYYYKYRMNELFESDLLSEFELIKVSRNEYICFQEEPMEYLWFLVEGRAKVIKVLANGKNLLLSFYEPFQVIGDVELIRETATACTAQALTDCYLLILPMAKFKFALQKDGKLLHFMCKSLAEKLDHISNNSSINLLYPLENRLASYVSMVAEQSDRLGKKRCFNENLTQLAELLGTSYRHLLRTLNGMCQSEILSRQKEGYIILNEEKLVQLAGGIYK